MKHIFLTAALLCAASSFALPPNGYYNSLEGLSKESLKTAAKQKVRSHTAISYGSKTWDAFKTTDVKTIDGVDYWWDMYSSVLVAVSSGHPGMNIEHSVANSWWGKTQNDAYKDLFHLNPSNAEANSAKSNYPLGIVAGTPKFDNGVTKVGRPASGDCYGAPWVYEPADCYKGDFARAFFYIFTVYDDIAWQASASDRNFMFDGSSYPSLRPWAIDQLLEWAEKDPVDRKETERNEAIYAIQRNRNPFIDIPDLARYVWGDKSSEPFHYDPANYPDPDPDPDPDPGTDPNPGIDGNWILVNSTADLSENETYILIDSKIGFGLTPELSGKFMKPTETQLTVTDGRISSIPADIAAVTLEAIDGGYAICVAPFGGTEKKYLASPSTKTMKLADSRFDEGVRTEIAITDGVAEISFGEAGNLYYNPSAPRFTTYTSTGQTPLSFYRKDTSGVSNPAADRERIGYCISGNTLTLPAGAMLFDATGRCLASGKSETTLVPGVYIIAQPGKKTAKIMIADF